MSLLKDYVTEIFGEQPDLAAKYAEGLKKNGTALLETNEGFMTYEFKGDAVILYDLYVKPEFRSRGTAWRFHNALLDLAKKLNKRVFITFSEFSNKRSPGLAAIKTAGFQPCYQHADSEMFIKGI